MINVMSCSHEEADFIIHSSSMFKYLECHFRFVGQCRFGPVATKESVYYSETGRVYWKQGTMLIEPLHISKLVFVEATFPLGSVKCLTSLWFICLH